MLYHVSIEADEPRRVAHVIAEIWGGIATPFPMVAKGSWVAMAGDDRSTLVEVYPRGVELYETPGDADPVGHPAQMSKRTATHMAIGTNLDMDAILAIAAREGWPAKYRCRGGSFGVVEMWIEGSQMIEVLTPEMQAEYLETTTIEGWRKALAQMGVVA